MWSNEHSIETSADPERTEATQAGIGRLVLREVEDRDLSVLFVHSTDRDAIRMAAFTSPDPDDRAAFEQRWARVRGDASTTNRIIELDGRVVGHIASFDLEGLREITYWIGREDRDAASPRAPSKIS
jgi:RimJ/RimL family protein N-acetyltransferase